MAPLRALLVLLAPPALHVSGCTTIGVTRSASADGSTMVTHTSDCFQCDSRVAHIPAKDWPAGAMRPVYHAKLEWPREVSTRSPTYAPQAGQNWSVPDGYIPEVAHTYAYWEAVYGYMNEHGLTLGESTCAANFPVARENLEALLWIRPLTQLAMERCKTARCAIETMGALAEKYGFYGEDPGASGAGEALVIVDGTETWAFEITGDTTDKGAFWAASRVKEGHVVAVANNFVIREVDCSDKENYMCSTELLSKAKAAGAWDGKGAFDWAVAMAPDIRHFSYTPGFDPIPEYTTARLWRVFSQVAPSLNMKRTDDARAVPFSVKSEKKITARDLMDLKRDHYEGTDIDLTVGAFAGPFGSPNRLEGGDGLKEYHGQFARAISLPRTSYASLGQSFSDAKKPLTKWWFATDTPASSVFVPFYPATSDFASAYRTGNMNEYDESSAWWVFDFVANWMEINYAHMSQDVKAKITEMQDYIDKALEPVDELLLKSSSVDAAYLEKAQTSVQNHVVDTWRSFGKSLIVKYNDGRMNANADAGGLPTAIGYPAWYLEMFGLDNDIRPKWGMPSIVPPSLYSFPPMAAASDFLATVHGNAKAVLPVDSATMATLLSYFAIFAAGLSLGRRTSKRTDDADYRVAPS
eukprot:TRINITY_DN16792_c0_g2_i1.p1 TRINITY_DN16792_c0_g2~~TRINITY_DN16792_c0_g2_i1.p1  ORF type:complete len:663 (+),score=108.45 TRINITY_DN16792_c0_g2_i1:77-1990(+)